MSFVDAAMKLGAVEAQRDTLLAERKELLEAAEILASYMQGFSENRTVAEAKEIVERVRAARIEESGK